MPLGRFNLNNNQNILQNPFPMRGLERFMQKRGMSFPPGMPQGGIFQESSPQGGLGNLSNTLNVQVPPQKSGGIKAFLSQFGRKPK